MSHREIDTSIYKNQISDTEQCSDKSGIAFGSLPLYNTTAFLYESTAAFEEPRQTCEEIQALMASFGVTPPGLLGDLGSGTGLMSILFAELGWQVHGIELSPAMIEVANRKWEMLPPLLQERLHWCQGDITTFELPGSPLLDAAVCLCNTINHLAEWEQVEAFIQSAFKAIRPGGLLVLDSDRLETFQGFFNHPPTVVWDDGKHRLTRTCVFEASTGKAEHLALVERYTATGLERVSEEPMTLRYHPEKQLLESFLAAGFTLESATPYNPYPTLYQGFIPKALWVFRRP
jgi:SAM-dependent methyltransferase